MVLSWNLFKPWSCSKLGFVQIIVSGYSSTPLHRRSEAQTNRRRKTRWKTWYKNQSRSAVFNLIFLFATLLFDVRYLLILPYFKNLMSQFYQHWTWQCSVFNQKLFKFHYFESAIRHINKDIRQSVIAVIHFHFESIQNGIPYLQITWFQADKLSHFWWSATLDFGSPIILKFKRLTLLENHHWRLLEILCCLYF